MRDFSTVTFMNTVFMFGGTESERNRQQSSVYNFDGKWHTTQSLLTARTGYFNECSVFRWNSKLEQDFQRKPPFRQKVQKDPTKNLFSRLFQIKNPFDFRRKFFFNEKPLLVPT